MSHFPQPHQRFGEASYNRLSSVLLEVGEVARKVSHPVLRDAPTPGLASRFWVFCPSEQLDHTPPLDRLDFAVS